LFSFAAGSTIASAAGATTPVKGAPISAICIVLLLCAWALKLIWWRRADRSSLALAGSTPETATGLGVLGKVRLLERPHTGPNYLTKEMVHRVARKHARNIRGLALIFGALLPLLICAISLFAPYSMIWQSFAFLFLLAGLFAERWLFFAEAQHSVSLYY
jgi:DMSO reductase anchor subunit